MTGYVLSDLYCLSEGCAQGDERREERGDDRVEEQG